MRPVTVIVAGLECSVLDGVWSAPNPALAGLLQSVEDWSRVSGGPTGGDPDPDLTSARLAAGVVGGTVAPDPDRVVDHPSAPPGTVY